MTVPPPAAPAVGEVAIALSLLLLYLVAFGFLQVYRASLSRILLYIAGWLDGKSIPTGIRRIHPFGPLVEAIRYVDQEVQSALGSVAQYSERGALWLFQLARRQFEAIGDQIGGLAYDVWSALTRTATVTIPNATHRAQLGVLAKIAAARAIAVTAAGAIAHDLPGIRGRIREGERDLGRIGRRVRQLEKRFALPAFAVLVGAALVRLGLGALRCPQFLKAAKRTCSADTQLLDSLLADLTMIVGAISLVEFARELETVTDEVANGIRHLIREA